MRRGRAVRAGSAAFVVAAMVAGCGLPIVGSGRHRDSAAGATPPGATQAGATPSHAAGASPVARLRATVARAQRTHEIPTPAPSQGALGGWRSPVQAVQVFADAYINWTADTVATHLRVLAQAGVGQARSAMTLAASQVARDDALKLGGISNAGTVEAIAPVTGERNVYAVVTRERTTATNTNAYQGLRPAWHVTLATVTEVDGRLWTISAWQPEN
ncbi:MAG: hypothetical protein ACXVSE_20500 [Solirubrobacteraceae bacterium]